MPLNAPKIILNLNVPRSTWHHWPLQWKKGAWYSVVYSFWQFQSCIDALSSRFKLLLSEAEPVKVISFSDYCDPVWGPRSNPTESLLYMCSVCIDGDLLLLNHAGLMRPSAVCQTSLLWQRTTMTLHQSANYHLHGGNRVRVQTGASQLDWFLCLWNSLV